MFNFNFKKYEAFITFTNLSIKSPDSHQIVALGRDDLSGVGVPEHQVCVGSHSDAALTGVQVKDLGCVRAGYGHKLVLIHLSGHLKRKERDQKIK